MARSNWEIQTRVIPSSEAKLRLAQLVDDVCTHGTRYIIQRFDTPRAVVISLADYQQLLTADKAGSPATLREAPTRYHLGKNTTAKEIDALFGEQGE